ncbi:nitrogenase stabilizing/protective protein NifW [Candidatus Macondimonas diazotrophica]|jgi:nitrogenase-stabilizing/protective protein|uniref:Nitrogenase-stabilizing/protective protein NifW n=1 Tax=Candidatus Macondimonas diazotrophica TaxID=2305248 RepID=A0A4Z0F8I6_9GAMM|nr:nitrogenase stabilizing/protective protein NifW [Candidatus Macondimonas diazotrophica]NCU01835.1 nitrogenase stabilizing/protective protein NifW [Candidatus Macondimonas diazotrophica]TFZ81907.1 nitrogenase stabilizing/protective protein NifW [Candidatus Macondimonas diazotrophica]HBG31630.1 nitrogenase stabilizing/protective protein NifW [Gammaproteobacteria bacterium]HCO43582.1 nitrogenase stabilizing/protective protein NifW [Gammaproteobacteria bacterium]
MSKLLDQLGKFSDAEEFLVFLDVPFEPAVVQVNRLHILKRFSQYLARARLDELDEAAQRDSCRALMIQAYEDFVHSTAAQEKVFKVFQDADGQRVSLDSLRASLPSQRT